MCGIAGMLATNPNTSLDKAYLSEMCQTIAHRGPDDEGLFFDGALSMGMRRLSIIDLHTGHQPMTCANGQYVIVFNGEIYNYSELRETLKHKGHRFVTESDTEVVLNAYVEFGPQCLLHFNGMFGLSIWDRFDKRLFLARDRIGIKPLYYFNDSKWLIFGSEIKSILKHPHISREIDPVSLSYYIKFGHVGSPRTLFRDVKKLPPASYLIADSSGMKIEKYWHCIEKNKGNRSIEQCAEEFLDLFEKSVKRRMIADVPLGAFLSGGLDSSSIVAFMSKLSSQPTKTYAIGFSEKDRYHDEREIARYVSETFKTDHHEIEVTPNIADLMQKLVWYLDEPVADTSYLVTYLVSQLASKSVKVILSGVGGDELFGGYRRYLGVTYDRYFDFLPSSLVRWTSKTLSDLLPADRSSPVLNKMRLAKSYLRSLSLSPEGRYDAYVSLLSEDLHTDLMTHSVKEAEAVFAERHLLYKNGAQFDPLNRLLHLDINTTLVDSLLLFTDKMSMACSLEARVPFLDHELVEWAMSVPMAYKIKGSKLRYLQKYAMKPLLPERVMKKPKQGFGCPVGSWFRNDLKDFTRDILSSSRLRESNLFDQNIIENILVKHERKEEDYSDILFALLTFELWHQTFIE